MPVTRLVFCLLLLVVPSVAVTQGGNEPVNPLAESELPPESIHRVITVSSSIESMRYLADERPTTATFVLMVEQVWGPSSWRENETVTMDLKLGALAVGERYYLKSGGERVEVWDCIGGMEAGGEWYGAPRIHFAVGREYQYRLLIPESDFAELLEDSRQLIHRPPMIVRNPLNQFEHYSSPMAWIEQALEESQGTGRGSSDVITVSPYLSIGNQAHLHHLPVGMAYSFRVADIGWGRELVYFYSSTDVAVWPDSFKIGPKAYYLQGADSAKIALYLTSE